VIATLWLSQHIAVRDIYTDLGEADYQDMVLSTDGHPLLVSAFDFTVHGGGTFRLPHTGPLRWNGDRYAMLDQRGFWLFVNCSFEVDGDVLSTTLNDSTFSTIDATPTGARLPSPFLDNGHLNFPITVVSNNTRVTLMASVDVDRSERLATLSFAAIFYALDLSEVAQGGSDVTVDTHGGAVENAAVNRNRVRVTKRS
jgi:hypothetical protein